MDCPDQAPINDAVSSCKTLQHLPFVWLQTHLPAKGIMAPLCIAETGHMLEPEEATQEGEYDHERNEEEEYELDENMLPSTLFFGVRGKQVVASMSCSV